ncbi:MAG: cell division topological specificity factor MinE [Lachnospiraceae bacterium]
MGVFEQERKNPSVTVAKNRLKLLLVSDRTDCLPDMVENLSRDLYQTVAKYMQITKEEFDVRITHTSISIRIMGEDT